ncbi:MAG: tRNA (adenosine(37)-N6)-threonylcarbamoyltransferase complex dimerization subunit type 1 TsaB [Verrucomicrobia bacterium]|nr:tRNA (adenosine(37)-N6)-threonylcarbamoyltransferase complex dimerization subunit type 1 TsaB [Verrucomicrobiota bacterium]
MILALETSTRHASLALYDPGSGTVVAERVFSSDRAHNAAIFAPLGELLEGRRDRLAGILVGLGPGSYGGVRVGLAVANGLSVALGVPVLGGSSLEALEVGADSHVIVGDARRGSGFLAVIRDRKLQGEPELVPDEAMGARMEALSTEGLGLYSADEKVVAANPGVILAHPSAVRLAIRQRESDFGGSDRAPLEPVYLRAPYITEPKARG